MRLLAGLGNPGAGYSATRHNVGFRVIDQLYPQLRRVKEQHSSRVQAWSGRLSGCDVALIKPQTYMNLSGPAVSSWVTKLQVRLAEVMVVVDDVNLPIGDLRLRGGGSAGGHNGLRSVIEALGNEAVPRLRVGIGRPENPDLTDHVLGPFTAAEEEALRPALALAQETILIWLRQGISQAMNHGNRRVTDAEN